MNVVFAAPAGFVAGGHKVQEERTAAALRRHGVTVTMLREGDPLPADCDIVHAWWPSLETVRAARARRIPVVASTVYWSREFAHALRLTVPKRVDVRRRLRLGLAMARQGVRLRHVAGAERLLANDTYLRMLFESADLLLPNSTSEAELLAAELGVTTPSRVVPNAADPELFRSGPPSSERQGVVCVARIEPAKNQLALIKELRGTGLPLTIVGDVHPEHSAYGNACRRAAGPDVVFSGPVDHGVLSEIYRLHRVHVLPSWWETTGLVSLEAALSGCAVVSTECGGAREYLRDDAWYVDPATPGSIRAAVVAAHEAGARPALRERVAAEYTWDDAARATMAAYAAATS
ncbi:MAG: hypothetical protein QOI82_1579 [Actinomycetota bacterium]|nr:hypothetical protein [Actinomycetota bacterium]